MFSARVGGIDNEVKEFFFSLPRHQLNDLLTEYGRKFGNDTREYAEEAYPHWKSGTRKMSGLVAERLFDLLPNRMPVQKKYDLVRKLWEHECPHSKEVFYIGRQPDPNQLNDLNERVARHLGQRVRDYFISDRLSQKFEWLASGDSQVKQQLLNYFQQLNKQLLANALGDRLVVLANYVQSSPEDHLLQTVKVGHHIVEIRVTHLAAGILDAATVKKIRDEWQRAKWEADAKAERQQNLLFWGIGIIVVVILFKACSHR